jgi:hypothetical protein
MGLMLIYEKLLKADRQAMRDYQGSWKWRVVIFVESK